MKTQNILALISEHGPTVTSIDILPGEIEGIETLLHSVPAGDEFDLAPAPDRGRVFLFLRGHAVASCGDRQFRIREIALLAVDRPSGLRVGCEEERVSFLDLRMSLTEEDRRMFDEHAEEYPFFATYSECGTYREAIKSEKTVNRTLLPEYTFPRLCVGSVQTAGPDEVARHKHPMLEQLFLGLQGNDCVVKADALESPFGEFEILHIPPASDHGVTVAEGKELHYIWIDVFRNASGMQYIADTHL